MKNNARLALLFWGLSGVIFFATTRGGAATAALSLANPSAPVAAGGNNDSLGSVISPDGLLVLFLSSANNLVTNDDNGRFIDIFLRNRTNGTTTLVSVSLSGSGGGNGHSVSPVISTNERYVVFESEASNLVANDVNNASDVFLRDLVSGTTTLVSVNRAGTGGGNGPSTSPVMSPDGRYVAFVSAASDLVANDTNNATDVFVRDMQSGSTSLASVRADGSTSGNASSDSPVLTPDGRWLAFASWATDLVAGVTNTGEIYVRDLTAGATFWASTNSAALMRTVTNAPNRTTFSFNPAISADGKFVAFKSFGAARLLLRHNLQTGATDLVSTNAVLTAFDGSDSSGPEMTPDGRFIAFTEATALNGSDAVVYLWDAQTGTRTLVSANLDGAISPGSYSDTPAVSSDGRFVAFLSDATGLVTNEVDGSYQVYLRDTASGTTKLVSADLDSGVSGATDGAIPTLSDDGRYVAFDSFDGDYVANDINNAFDVFVRDTTTDVTELISEANAAAQSLTANGPSTILANSASADGRWVVFVSAADNLTTNDFNGSQDVFLRDLQTGTNILVSVNSAGTRAASGFSGSPVISANGRYVAFVSNAGDIAATGTNRADNIFLRDLQAGTTTLVSVSADGTTGGTAASSSPLISSDGRYVAFYSLAKNLVPNDLSLGGEIFWRDAQNASTVSVSTNGRALNVSSMSADGRYLAYATSFLAAHQLNLWDSQNGNMVYSTQYPIQQSPAFTLSPDGRVLVYAATNSDHRVIAHDLVAATDTVIGYSPGSGGPKPQTSGNGRFITFVSPANSPNAPNTANGTNNVFLYDLQTATTTLLSFNRDRVASGNGPSDSPSISADGRFIAYRSAASDLVESDTNGQTDVFVFDRRTGANTLVSANQAGTGPGNDASSTPLLSADGSTVVFRSFASDLVSGDFNNTQDVFSFPVPRVTFADSDGDGMDDAWEKASFGNLSHDGSGDSDSDGVSDLMEYKTGTNPMSAASRFSAQANVSPGAGQVTITWEAAPGRSYRVQYKDDLSQTQWSDLSGGVGVYGVMATCVDTAGAFNQRFYRVALVE